MSTISSFFANFIQLKNLRESTSDIYRLACAKLITAVGDINPADVTPLMALQFAKSLQTSGLAPASANMYLRAVKAFFNFLVSIEMLPKNPFKAAKPLKDPNVGRDLYTPDERHRLLLACPTDRWRLIIALAATAGLRRGEILNLTVSEIDLLSGAIVIAPKPDSPRTWRWDVKDTDVRCVPIHPEVERLLLRALAELPDAQPYVCLHPAGYQRLIARKQRDGHLPFRLRACPEVNFRRTFCWLCRRAGVENKTFHALRASAITYLADNGLPPHDLAAIAGHADLRTTYRHYVKPEGPVAKVKNLWANKSATSADLLL